MFRGGTTRAPRTGSTLQCQSWSVVDEVWEGEDACRPLAHPGSLLLQPGHSTACTTQYERVPAKTLHHIDEIIPLNLIL